MDAIGKIVATAVANLIQDENEKLEKKDRMNSDYNRLVSTTAALIIIIFFTLSQVEKILDLTS